MQIENEVKLDFKDVLIKPKRSQSPSRSSVKLEKEYKFLHSKQSWWGIPVIAANMDTVGTISMANILSKQNMMIALHKYYRVEKLVNYFNKPFNICAFYTIGMKQEDLDKLKEVEKLIDHHMLNI